MIVFIINNDEFFIFNDEFRIKNDELCIQNDDLFQVIAWQQWWIYYARYSAAGNGVRLLMVLQQINFRRYTIIITQTIRSRTRCGFVLNDEISI